MATFMGSWDSKYYSKGKVENHTLAWFNEDRGYEKESIAKIKKLRVGQSVEIEKGHTIIRKS
jgi:hypothetical protein